MINTPSGSSNYKDHRFQHAICRAYVFFRAQWSTIPPLRRLGDILLFIGQAVVILILRTSVIQEGKDT
jgi:hypothetical protein